MQKDDREDFALCMAMLATAFEKEGIKKEKIQLYEQFLKDIPMYLLKLGVIKIIKTRKFSGLPTIAEIREACKSEKAHNEWELFCAKESYEDKRISEEKYKEALELYGGKER